MSEDDRRRAYADAFIDQARSDWAVYRLLAAQDDVVVCHELHYLQMVCEKLAKAYRLRDTKAKVDELVSKHTGFAKFVGPFFLAALKEEFRGRDAQLAGLIARARTFAREIEKLAPAIDRTAAPENAEYPWERDGKILAPCQYEFPSLELLRQRVDARSSTSSSAHSPTSSSSRSLEERITPAQAALRSVRPPRDPPRCGSTVAASPRARSLP